MRVAGYPSSAGVVSGLLILGLLFFQTLGTPSSIPSREIDRTPVKLPPNSNADQGTRIAVDPDSVPFMPPPVTLVEGERVQPDEVMALTRSILIESGESIDRTRRSLFNLTLVRNEVNEYLTGYALPVIRTGEGFAFANELKGWRATSTSDVSVWPPAVYDCAREETRSQAASLEPISMNTATEVTRNLRLYYFPIRVAYDGSDYEIADSVLAFFVHPESGSRMTAVRYDNRTLAAVQKPLSVIVHLYVAETQTYKGPLGIGKVHAPAKFFAQSIQFDPEITELHGPLGDELQQLLLEGPEFASSETIERLRVEMQRSTEASGSP